MKKTLLIGLAAVALGSMTACSNILEEEGTISASAKTGSLVIGLTQTPVNVVTKSDDKGLDINSFKDKVTVKLEAYSSEVAQPNSITFPIQKLYSEWTNEPLKVSTQTKYKLTASCQMSDNTNFGFDMPEFEDVEDNIVVNAGTTKYVNLKCTLDNSIVEIDLEGLGNEDNLVGGVYFIPKDLYLTTNDNSELSLIKDGVNNIGNKIIFAKAGISAKIKLTGYLSNDTEKDTLIETDFVSIGEKNAESVGNTVANTKYLVRYALKGDEGKLQLQISMNDLVKVEDFDITVDPYATQN